MKKITSLQKLSIGMILFTIAAVLMAKSDSKIFNEIVRAELQFTQVFTQTGGAGLKDLYAVDGMILPPNAEPIKGNGAIGDYWRGGFEAGVKNLKLVTLEVSGNADTANEIGSYELYDASSNVIDKGKYLVLWKKVNGQWKLYRDIWNSSQTK